MIDSADYTLQWPSSIVADEIQHLIYKAEVEGVTSDWRSEVETLLQQAFVSTGPVEDFRQAQQSHPPPSYNADEEPF